MEEIISSKFLHNKQGIAQFSPVFLHSIKMRFSIATLTLLAAAALAAPLPGDDGDIGSNVQKNINNQKTIIGNDFGLGLLQQDQRLAPLYNNPDFRQAAQGIQGIGSTTSLDELVALLVRHLNLNSYGVPTSAYQPYLQPGYQQQQLPPYYQQGYQPQGYPPQGYPPQGYPPQGYPQQGYPQLYQQQQLPPQGYQPNNYGGLGANLLSNGGGNGGGFIPQNLGQQQGQPFNGRLNRRSAEGANVEGALRGGE